MLIPVKAVNMCYTMCETWVVRIARLPLIQASNLRKVLPVNISPRDVAQVGGGLMYVRSISTPDKFGNVAIEGVRATDQTASCTLHKDDEVEAVAVNVSRSEAQEWFDRESRLNLIVGEMRALYGRMLSFVSNSKYGDSQMRQLGVSVVSRDSTNAAFEFLDGAERALLRGSEWFEGKRAECIKAFEDFHADYQAQQGVVISIPEFTSDCIALPGVLFLGGGVYEMTSTGYYEGDQHGYMKVVGTIDGKAKVNLCFGGSKVRSGVISSTTANPNYLLLVSEGDTFRIPVATVKLLPIGSLDDIGGYLKVTQYRDRLGNSLESIFREVFTDSNSFYNESHYLKALLEAMSDVPIYERDNYDFRRDKMLLLVDDVIAGIMGEVDKARELRSRLAAIYA